MYPIQGVDGEAIPLPDTLIRGRTDDLGLSLCFVATITRGFVVSQRLIKGLLALELLDDAFFQVVDDGLMG